MELRYVRDGRFFWFLKKNVKMSKYFALKKRNCVRDREMLEYFALHLSSRHRSTTCTKYSNT